MTAEVDMKNTIQRALVSVACLAVTAALADGIAFLSNLKGDVAVDGAKGQILAELTRGQKLVLGKDSLASVMYVASGKEFVLRGPGEYVLKDNEVAAAAGAAPVTRTTEWRPTSKVLGQVAGTSAASVRMRSISAPKNAPQLLFPTQGNIATLQPTFRWSTQGPTEVTLSVVGDDKPVHTGKTNGNAYRIPGKLKPDTEYVWVVSAGTNELGSGKFRTLPADAIQQAEKRKPSDRAEFSDRVMYALFLQDLGATQEAQELWSRLAKERADLPELAGLAR
jgi:hypothetical protein